MVRAFAVLAALLTVTPAIAAAEPQPPSSSPRAVTTVAASFAREASRVAALQPADPAPAPGRKRQGSFLRRRPVLSGLLIGAVAGTAIAAGAWGNEGAFVGFYGGAGAGAATGWLLSR
jgi:hypothetical protein